MHRLAVGTCAVFGTLAVGAGINTAPVALFAAAMPGARGGAR